MGQAISKLTIKGYKSIRNLENFELRNLNILIGPNGAGKSNFVEFFRMLKEIPKGQESLDHYVNYMGGANRLLYLGSKITPQMTISISLPEGEYCPDLDVTSDNRLIKSRRALPVTAPSKGDLTRILDRVFVTIDKQWQIYHFHDTSDFAGLKLPTSEGNYDCLFPDASNLAPLLFRMKEKQPRDYQTIIDVVSLAAPFFDDFRFDLNEKRGEIKWWWLQKGLDYKFHPSQISDGTLRFICLATALLQPDPPSTILLDEPELGLHPYALTLLAGLIQKASKRMQVIVSTQSAGLLDHFQPEDIILVERKNDESVFDRPDTEKLKIWLEEYSLGDIWSRNIIEGAAGQ